MQLEHYAHVAATLVGVDVASHEAVLASMGVTQQAYEAASEYWGERLADDQALMKSYGEAYHQALARRVGDGPQLSFDRFVEANIVYNTDGDYAASCAAAGMAAPLYELRSLEWRMRMSEDCRLLGLFQARLQVGVARGLQPRQPLAPPQAARLAFPRTCPRCGAHKCTQPRTAYVYCDFCAYLFDYDNERARRPGDDSFPEVVAILSAAVGEELRRLRTTGQLDAYWETWRWIYEIDIELGPEGWSPRVAEPEYRRVLLDWAAESCVLRNTNTELRGKSERIGEAYAHACEQPSREALVALFRTMQQELDREIQIYATAGLFERHPDGLDVATYRHLSTIDNLREVLPNADAAARESILLEAALRLDPVELPPVDMERTTCGSCGGPLLLVAGAQRLLCEACGVVLDASRSRFPCVQCGAPVLAVASKEIACAYCGARFSPTP